MTTLSMPVRIVEETPAYWRVLFDHPPLNVVDGSVLDGLQELLSRMDTSPDLRVVVFESANPEFYLAHFDMSGHSAEVTKAVGPSGLPVAMDVLVRLTTSPIVTIAKISCWSHATRRG
jgi:enoyl-CoA hydratase/carnithine racemase